MSQQDYTDEARPASLTRHHLVLMKYLPRAQAGRWEEIPQPYRDELKQRAERARQEMEKLGLLGR